MHRLSRWVSASALLTLSPWSMGSDIAPCDPAPAAIVKVAPQYPLLESPIGVEGYVIVEFTITENGDTVDIEVVESISDPKSSRFEEGFGKAAAAAVGYWKYAETDARCRLRQKLTFLLEK